MTRTLCTIGFILRTTFPFVHTTTLSVRHTHNHRLALHVCLTRGGTASTGTLAGRASSSIERNSVNTGCALCGGNTNTIVGQRYQVSLCACRLFARIHECFSATQRVPPKHGDSTDVFGAHSTPTREPPRIARQHGIICSEQRVFSAALGRGARNQVRYAPTVCPRWLLLTICMTLRTQLFFGITTGTCSSSKRVALRTNTVALFPHSVTFSRHDDVFSIHTCIHTHTYTHTHTLTHTHTYVHSHVVQRYDGATSPRGLTIINMDDVIRAFLPHIRHHLGVPKFPAVHGYDAARLDAWEVNRLARRVAVRCIMSANESLLGIVARMKRVPTVVIDEGMAARVALALDHLDDVRSVRPLLLLLHVASYIVIFT